MIPYTHPAHHSAHLMFSQRFNFNFKATLVLNFLWVEIIEVPCKHDVDLNAVWAHARYIRGCA